MTERDYTIFYVGPLGLGSTTLQRMESLKQLGHTIIPLDMNPFYRTGARLTRSILHRLAWGPAVAAMNRAIIQQAAGIDYDWAWVDKGTWIYPETVEALKKGGRSLAIHYTPDPAIVFHKTRHFIRSIPVYDILITTKTYETDKYKQHGAQKVIFAHQGYDEDIFQPRDIEPEQRNRLQSDVLFIGHCEKHYYRRVRAAHEAAAGMAVWGRWGRQAMLHPWLKKIHQGEGIWHVEYAEALCCAKIGLGLLSRLAPDRSTTRTYEIPACGTFMLAERTEEHRSLFEEGKEAEFFETDEELKDKLKYYLSHDDARMKIGRAGRERCVRSGYSNKERLKGALKNIQGLIGL
jgi:spore maturation protein CgeB